MRKFAIQNKLFTKTQKYFFCVSGMCDVWLDASQILKTRITKVYCYFQISLLRKFVLWYGCTAPKQSLRKYV